MFAHLHVRSCYSFLEGTATPQALARQAAAYGLPALALTDHGWLTGAVAFVQACQAEGVHPILGLEVDVLPPGDILAQVSGSTFPLVLLAMNAQGWRALCRLSSALRTQAAPAPGGVESLSLEQLASDSAGLLCLTGGGRSYLDGCVYSRDLHSAGRWLERLAQLFPGRLYLELDLQPHDSPEKFTEMLSLAEQCGLPVVAGAPVYFLEASGAGLQRTASAIRLNTSLSQLPPDACAPAGAWFLSPVEMEERFAGTPQALASTLEIVERCQFELPLHRPLLPEIELPPGETALETLRRRAESGARRLYGDLDERLRQRLDHELQVIADKGYAVFFLIVEEILADARRRGVPLSSRGSAASSLVAHCLGITSPDPLRLNLYFERFLNPARRTPPDIDTDLCSRRRDGVIQFVYRRFGEDRVAMVSTINCFRRRSALRETAKAYGLPPRHVGELVERMPRWGWGPPGLHNESEEPFAELQADYPGEPYLSIFRDAAALIGQPRHLSIHPGGIVIAPGLMTDFAPVQLASKGVLITQFDLDGVEAIGLVKIDLLGIRGLSVLGDVAEWLYRQGPAGRESPVSAAWVAAPQNPIDLLDAISEDDPETAAAVREGRTIGCFQIESPGMRAILKEIQAASVDEIMAALALFRPGPLLGGLKDSFVRRHRGQEPVMHLHPALAPLLEETYGVILYQEQVLRIAHELAGLSLADADLLRRAMSHFDPGKEMHKLQERFISGVVQRTGMPVGLAQRVWEMMAAFAGYGFPKAHAASYAQVAWRSAWCKTHFPGVFMAGVLANWGGYYGQGIYMNEARRLGLSLQPPHINYSGREFRLVYRDGQPVLFMGLDQVRDLTRRTQARILQERPFRSLSDFLARADPRPAEAENLIISGGLNGMGVIPSLLRQLKGGGWQGGQLPLFSLDAGRPAPDSQPDWTDAERMAAEIAVLGVSASLHPLELVAGQLESAGVHTTLEAAGMVGQEVRVAGTRQTWRRSMASQREAVYFMSLEDLEGMLDVMIAAPVYRRDHHAISSQTPFVVEGEVQRSSATGEPFIRASRIWAVQ